MFDLTPFNRKKNEISSFNPFRAIEELENSFFRSFSLSDFKTDIKDNGDAYILEADLPGFKKEDIKIDIKENYLSINAERRYESEEKNDKENYIKSERSYGSFSRSFDVSTVKTDEIDAQYKDGVLRLVMPKKEQSAPTSRRLDIH